MPTNSKTARVEGYRSNDNEPQSWWNDTEIIVNSGDSISFDGSNPGDVIRPWEWSDGFGPAGDLGNLGWQDALAYRSCGAGCDFDFMSLIGKVGVNGSAFYIGETNAVNAPASGRLYLACNDGVNFEDNSGGWDIEVTFEECVEISNQYFGSQEVLADKIDVSLLEEWGVILTIQCDTTDTDAEWTSTAKSNLVGAFNLINSRLQATTTRSFKDVFGGLELRMVDSLGSIGGRAFNGHLIRFGDVGRDGGTRADDRTWGRTGTGNYPSSYGLFYSNNFGIRNTIIHELGHVFSLRVAAMLSVGSTYFLTSVKGATAAQDVGSYWENPDNSIGEIVPDHFLNWVRNSYVSANPDAYNASDPDDERRISAYWVGDIEFIEDGSNRGTSPGIQGFADAATSAASDALAVLEAVLS